MKFIFSLVILSVIFYGCNYNAMPVTYVLPINFEGLIAIVYSQKNGSRKIIDGRLQIEIPSNGIVLTSADFSDGWRDDIFVIKSKYGYDTLKFYLPNKDTTGNMFDKDYYKIYTKDGNICSVNFRQLISSVPINGKGCHFSYELIAIGRASSLNDTIGDRFKIKLENYLMDTLCRGNF